MPDYRIIMTEKAKQDILGIGDYITNTLLEPDTSKHFIRGLRNSISQLRFFPYKFPFVQDEVLKKQGIHYMPYKNCYIFYKILEEKQVVIVLRTGYNKRNWKMLL